MIHWRRFFRRNKKKLSIYLALLSLGNFLLPQHASAQPIPTMVTETVIESATEPALVVSTDQRPLLPIPTDLPVQKTVRVMATAYTSSVDETDSDPWTTASGARAGDGVIAANGLPFGTKVRLPDQYGDKILIVLDRMSQRYGNRYVDIWMPTKQQAKQWGVKPVRMEIL